MERTWARGGAGEREAREECGEAGRIRSGTPPGAERPGGAGTSNGVVTGRVCLERSELKRAWKPRRRGKCSAAYPGGAGTVGTPR